MYKFGKKSLKRMEGVHPDLIKVANRALEISHHRGGPDFTIPKYGGVRTAEVQNKLYLRKRSKRDGFKKKSKHQIREGNLFGHALDVAAYVGGSYVDGDQDFQNVAVCMLEAAIELGVLLDWGGNWKGSWDKPHYQLS